METHCSHPTKLQSAAQQQGKAKHVLSGMARRSYHAHSLELGTICRAVVLGVVAEDSRAVEGAVILREVEPALEAMRALSSNS